MQHPTSADGLVAIFEPSVLVPVQFFAGLRHKAPAEGERRLMLAILEDAIECFQKHLWATDRKHRQLHDAAELWFLADEPGWLFSFVNICAAFEIHPSSLRQGLLDWKTRQLAGRAGQRSASAPLLS
ncbi:MAG: hypothetical protein J4F42_08825 [Desulfurellaceae bacterium]|nr:hypothetical protein [Desulfurellaceae bacterium]